MFPVLQLGRLALQVPGLMIILGVFLGISLAEHRLPQDGLTEKQFYTILYLGLGMGLLGARLFFVLNNLNIFTSSPRNIISLDTSLLDPFAGMALAGFSILIYGYRKKLSFWQTMDVFTPALAVFTIFLGLSHMASGDAFGSPTSLPWGIDLWGEKRHPSQVYEIIASSIILLLLWSKLGRQYTPGTTFLYFATLTAGAHLFLEAWRGDTVSMVAGIRMTQLIAWLSMSIGLFMIDRWIVTRVSRDGG